MTEAVKSLVKLSAKQKDGQTLSDHYDQVEQATGKRPEGAESVEPPEGTEYLWQWFWDLHIGRSYGMSGALPLTWSDMYFWSTLRNADLEHWEVGIIRAMDGAYLSEVNKEKPKSSSKSPPKHKGR